MAKFIRLTHEGDSEVVLNLQFIASIETDSGGKATTITMADGRKYQVTACWPSDVLSMATSKRSRRAPGSAPFPPFPL